MADIWEELVADCQAFIRVKIPKRTGMVTVRLHVEGGELKSWSPPSGQKWQTSEDLWVKRRLKGDG